ncbi:hypothetical protein HPB50_014594 [Hyalomma asiaticum]|uniref:Uncharacterized protein n=1 Tax=Hyalomma asiaticum TaxID=266040 RepID=A0ACB7T2T3_HYAAI|nr:hypothetical protein HPB50_014594 [Hyalomma asiaticum]
MSSRHYRVIFDGGSQRSFITIEASRQLGCQLLQEETVAVRVFGGHKTENNEKSPCENFRRSHEETDIIYALKVEEICREHIPILSEEVTKKMEEIGLDTRALCLKGEKENFISLLVGSDYYWRFVTGDLPGGAEVNRPAQVLYALKVE